jgi:hypothetical protein
MIDLAPTERGFMRGEFKDRYGKDCSIQESSIATEYCIWLGVDNERMHLTQQMAADLIRLLYRFVETGELREGSL